MGIKTFYNNKRKGMGVLLSNLKLMIHPGVILVTIVFTFLMCMILGFKMGIPVGLISMYQLLFHDKSHKWNGKEWVNETKKEETK